MVFNGAGTTGSHGFMTSIYSRNVLLTALSIITMIIVFLRETPNNNYINLVIVYRGSWLVVLYLFLCGINIFVWEKYNIQYLQIFGIDSKTVCHYVEFFEVAASLASLWSLGIITYLWVLKKGTAIGLNYAPVVLAFIFWFIILSPGNFFHKNTRQWIWNHVLGFFWGPYATINFASCWVADQFTSATVALVDFEYTICHFFFYVGNINCDSFHKILQPVFFAFPFVWRLMQCLCQYRDTNQTNHLLNAGKYATSLVAIFFSTIHLLTQEDPNEWSIYRTYWVVAITLSTLYSYTWDLTMDWGLAKRNNTTKKWHFLRDVLVYERPSIYYFAMCTNLMMRTTWLITLNPDYFGIHFRRDILVFFLASVELVRRIQWNFFRMEYEHVCKFTSNKFIDKHTGDGGGDSLLVEVQ